MNTPRGSLVNFVNMPLQPGSAGPTKHLKANWYDYQTALSKEVARIERIKELRTQMIGLIGTGIASGLFSFEHRPRGLLVTTSGPTARSSLRLGFRMIERARGARCPLASQPQAKRDERAAPI